MIDIEDAIQRLHCMIHEKQMDNKSKHYHSSHEGYKMNPKMNRLQLKVSMLVGKQKGAVEVMSVYELADDLGIEVTKRQANNMINKAKKEYGY
jgi:uncharacterized protein (DUF2344 family)